MSQEDVHAPENYEEDNGCLEISVVQVIGNEPAAPPQGISRDYEEDSSRLEISVVEVIENEPAVPQQGVSRDYEEDKEISAVQVIENEPAAPHQGISTVYEEDKEISVVEVIQKEPSVPQQGVSTVYEEDKEISVVQVIEKQPAAPQQEVSRDDGQLATTAEDAATVELVAQSSLAHAATPSRGRKRPTSYEDNLRRIQMDMFCDDEDLQLSAVQLTIRLFGARENPLSFSTLLGLGVVSRCVQFLEDDMRSELQYAAACLLTNIAAGTTEQINAIVKAGAAEQFVRILNIPTNRSVKQAICAVGNIIGDSPNRRDYLISIRVVPPMVRIAKSTEDVLCMRILSWTLLNLFRFVNSSPHQQIRQMCLEAFTLFIMKEDREVFENSIRGLTILSDGKSDWIEDVLDSEVAPKLLGLLKSDDYRKVASCLKVVGNILDGSIPQTQYLIDIHVLPILAILLQSGDNEVVKLAIQAVANITKGSAEQITAVIEQGIVSLLLDIFRAGDLTLQTEAVMVIAYIAVGKHGSHMSYLWTLDGAIAALCSMLRSKHWNTVCLVLEILQSMLQVAKGTGEVGIVAHAIEQAGGLDSIQTFLPPEVKYRAYQKGFNFIRNNQPRFRTEREIVVLRRNPLITKVI